MEIFLSFAGMAFVIFGALRTCSNDVTFGVLIITFGIVLVGWSVILFYDQQLMFHMQVIHGIKPAVSN